MKWTSSSVFKRKLAIPGLEITAEMKRKDGLWGRFGGGWNWKLGFMAGGRTVIIDLLIMSIRISRIKKGK